MAPSAEEYEYRITDGHGINSETIRVDSGSPPSIRVVDMPLAAPASSYSWFAGGNLLNDGRVGFIAACAQEGQLHLDAYSSAGRHLWRKPKGFPSKSLLGHNCGPYLAWDINHDGRTEVLCWISKTGWEKGREGMQVWYAVESGFNPGVYLVDMNGKTIFKEPYRLSAHFGWVARHNSRIPGLQPHTAEEARHNFGRGQELQEEMRELAHNPIFLSDGSHWGSLSEWQRKNFVPVHWDEGPEVAFIVRKEDKRVVKLNKNCETEELANSKLPETGNYGANLLAADMIGDYRENILALDMAENRLMVLQNPNIAKHRGYSPFEDFEYRHDRSQHGSGYYRYLSPPDTRVGAGNAP